MAFIAPKYLSIFKIQSQNLNRKKERCKKVFFIRTDSFFCVYKISTLPKVICVLKLFAELLFLRFLQ
ncbi:hypothetical protein PI23P_10185 [Polaribacter irgensii 23-P]|uniref:Uncharacterized protein n=1 Tax=Polaribacter irgensii 23-P TaxID=313594 RepID=A4C0P6_9FLAO|nr:hypothetical protein PI23P_10185 [Polaribacter irgensii 23-P]